MRAFFILLVVVSLTVAPVAIDAHAPVGAWQYLDEARESNPLDYVKGSDRFAPAIREAGPGFLTTERLEEIRAIADVFEAVAATEAEATEPTQLLELARIKAWASGRLIDFLATWPERLSFRVVEGKIQPEAAFSVDVIASDYTAVILEIDNGEGPTIFTSGHVEIESATEMLDAVDVRVPESGRKFTLLGFGGIPAGLTRVPLNFLVGETPEEQLTAVIDLHAPPKGRLRLAFQDEAGSPTAALVRINTVPDDRLVFINTAHDYEYQMHRIALTPEVSLNSAVFMNLTRGLDGPYWVVPGDIDMTIPAGDFRMIVWRGNEYSVLEKEFSIEEGGVYTETLVGERWIDMKRRGWWSGDGHIHARLMSDLDARRLMDWMEASDIHVGNVLQMGNHQRTFYEQRGFGRDFRVARGNRVLVPGQEDPRFVLGHAIGWNLEELVRDEAFYMLNDIVADRVRAQGGLYGAAHVLGDGFEIDRDLTLQMPRGTIDFGEILQFRRMGTDLYYEYLDLGFHLTASAGSDTPYIAGLGEVRIYANLGDAPFGADAWFDAVRAGRTMVSNGPVAFLDVDGHGPGDTVEVVEDGPIRVTVRAMGSPGETEPALVEIVSLSEVVASVSSDIGSAEVTLEAMVDSRRSRWIVARVTAADGSFAHTSPVYIQRPGTRTWNTGRVPELLERRRATLDGLDAMLDETQSLRTGGSLPPANIYGDIILNSAEELRLRIEMARDAYDQLEALYGAVPERDVVND